MAGENEPTTTVVETPPAEPVVEPKLDEPGFEPIDEEGIAELLSVEEGEQDEDDLEAPPIPSKQGQAGESGQTPPASTEPPVSSPSPVGEPPTPAKPAEPAEPAKPVDAVAKPPETPQAQEPEGGKPPVAPAQEPQAQPEAPKGATPEEIAVKRQALVDDVAGRYSLSEEQADQLSTNPNKVLPQMVGELYADIYDAVVSTMRTQIPGMIQQFSTYREQVSEGENAFFTRWPELKKKPEYSQDVQTIAATYRQLNPHVSREQFIEEVGAMAMWKLGLAGQASATLPTEPAPAAPPEPRQGRFVPAAPGASATAARQSPAPSGDAAMYAELADVEL